MDRQPVHSSMIASIGYDAETATLEIEFSNGGPVWQYYNFPDYQWNEFLYAGSHGKYFHAYIKDAYRGQRVG